MILLPQSVRIHFCTTRIHMRLSFEGLCNMVRLVMKVDPLSGHLFLFLNRASTHLKVLMWTRGGFTILHKRLERGQFVFAKQVSPTATSIEMDAHELSMLLEGLHLSNARSAERWRPPLKNSA